MKFPSIVLTAILLGYNIYKANIITNEDWLSGYPKPFVVVGIALTTPLLSSHS